MVTKHRSMARVVIIFCIAAITAFAGIAQADDGEWGGGRHHFKKVSEQLGLTDAQKAQAQAIFQANRAVMKPIFTSLRTERKILQALIHADKIDETAIRNETVKIALIQADLNVNRATVGAQFRAILTPEQVATLKTLPHKGDGRRIPSQQ